MKAISVGRGREGGAAGVGGTEDWELVALGLRDALLEESGTIWPLPCPPDCEHGDMGLLWAVTLLVTSSVLRKEGMV